MKVKIGNKIYDSDKEPILLILGAMDKVKIYYAMNEYCAYPENSDLNKIKEWKEKGCENGQ